MSEPIDDAARRAWQQQPGAVNTAAIAAAVQRRLADRRNRTLRFSASFAIIVPAWIAVAWLMPDLRPLAIIGLVVSMFLATQMYRRNAASSSRPGAALPCAAHERELLSRERSFYDSLPKWFIGPVILVQVAIVASLLTNPRFEKNAMFPVSLAAFVMTVITVLSIAFRRSRRMVGEIDREIALLKIGEE